METKSIWRESSPQRKEYPVLGNKISADVVVVGAGITGLLSAYLLHKSGKKVVILEAKNIGDGTTGFSSCHLNTDLDYEYRNVASTFGDTTAQIVANARVEGINFIESLVNLYSIDCDFKRVKGYLYTEESKEIKNLEEEAAAAKNAGLDVSVTSIVPLPFKTEKAVVFENQGSFNAQKFLLGLLDVLTTTDIVIYENSRVTDFKEQNGICLVSTAEGSIECKKVVYATHLPPFINVLQTMAAPYRSYVIAAKLHDDTYPEGLYWDTDDPYHYTKTYSNSDGKWLIVGGADHKTGEVEETIGQFENLEHYVRSHFNVAKITHRWSAQYYEPVDGLPYIGKNPFSDHTYVATGFSGDGLVYGAIASMIITDLIDGIENKWLKAFDSTRFTPVASAKDFIIENAEVAKHFIVDRFKTESKDFEEIQPGEGKIVTYNGEKLAVARDNNNDLHILSPECTHLKCFVQWNDGEKSWDCPCHGSRFSIKGEVIVGPAVTNLENKNKAKQF